jgi:beta-barrel assembly-enhancing protease
MVGAQIMYDAGYNPEAAVSFFNKLKQITGDKGGPQFLASHPDPGNRARDISQILSRFPPKQYQPEDSAEYLAAKQSLSNAAAKSEAATIPAAKPVETTPIPLEGVASNSFKTFDHDSFTISYPDNWSLTGDRSTAVTIYPKGGYVEGALAYGAMISGFRPDPPGKEPAAGFQQLIATTQQENPGLRLAGKPESFTLRGRPAQRVDLLGPSAVWENGQQVTERARMVALPEKHGEVLYAVFVAPDKDFQKLWPTFEQMLHSLQVK